MDFKLGHYPDLFRLHRREPLAFDVAMELQGALRNVCKNSQNIAQDGSLVFKHQGGQSFGG